MKKTTTIVMACKSCKRVFRVDLEDPDRDESDTFCPHCDTCYIIPAVSGEEMAAAASSSAGGAPEGSTWVEMEAEDLDGRVKSKTERGVLFGKGTYF